MDNKTIINTQTVLLTGTSEQHKRQELKDYFNQTWALYESLFDIVNNDEAYFKKQNHYVTLSFFTLVIQQPFISIS